MGIFGDLDVQAAADDPFAIDDGTYTAVVTGSEVKQNKDGNKNFLVLEYTIEDDGAMSGRKASEWKNIPEPGDDNADRSASFLKQRLLSLGVPADRINSFEPEDALGVTVVISVKNKDGYANVNKVEQPRDTAGSPSASGNAFAGLE